MELIFHIRLNNVREMDHRNIYMTTKYLMEYKKDFLVYLDSEGIVNLIKSAGLCYKQEIKNFQMAGSYYPPFRFAMKIDLLKIHELSGRLAIFFIEEPHKFLNIAEELVYYILLELTELKNLTKFDIKIVFYIYTFPNIFINNNFYTRSGLKAFRGILIGRTATYKYMRSKVCFCTTINCPNNNERRYWPPYDRICNLCYCPMEEDVGSVEIGEEISGLIICLNAYMDTGRFQSLKIKIRDEFCSYINLEIGSEYNLIGTFEGNHLVIWNINRNVPHFEQLSYVKNSNYVTIPNSVAALYHKIRNTFPECPWSFVGTISATICSQQLPVSSFFQLKLGLLLSLATQNSKDPPAPIVVIGADTCSVKKLIASAGRMAERFINYSSGYAQIGGEKRYNTREEVWYEAGALILGSTGVCNLGDWSRLRKDQCNYVCQVIESGKIILNNIDKTKTEAEFEQLNCAIWTYWGHITTNNQDQSMLRTLLNVFGLAFLADENNDKEAQKISNRIIELSIYKYHKPPCEVIPLSDLKEYISFINSRHLTLNDSASKLIHDFFVVIRKERPECLPIGAIKTITSLAEAHARLSLRNEIIYEDVVLILYLYNLSISTLFGRPVIEVKSFITSDEKQNYSPIHIYVKSFQKSLENHLENYSFLKRPRTIHNERKGLNTGL